MKQLQHTVTIWWQALQQREQRLVAAAAVVVLLGVVYWLIWQPVMQGQAEQQQRVQAAGRQLAQLQSLPAQSDTGTSIGRTGGSIAQIIGDSARNSGIRVSRMQPQSDQLTLVLEDVSFDALLTWLHALQYQHGVTLVSLDLASTDATGLVRVRRMVVE